MGFHSQWDGAFNWQLLRNLRKPWDAWRSMAELKEAIEGSKLLRGGAMERTVYVESHDEAGRHRLPLAISGRRDSWVGSRLSAMAVTLVMLSPGIPLLFQGQEFAMQETFSAYKAMDWSQKLRHEGTFRLHQHLIRLRSSNPGLQAAHVNVTCDEERKVLAIHRWSETHHVFGLCNFQRAPLVNYLALFPEKLWELQLNTADAQYYDSATVFQSNDLAQIEVIQSTGGELLGF